MYSVLRYLYRRLTAGASQSPGYIRQQLIVVSARRGVGRGSPADFPPAAHISPSPPPPPPLPPPPPPPRHSGEPHSMRRITAPLIGAAIAAGRVRQIGRRRVVQVGTTRSVGGPLDRGRLGGEGPTGELITSPRGMVTQR